MRVRISKEDELPFFAIEEGVNYAEMRDIPQDKVDWINKTLKVFLEVQRYLSYLYWEEE